MAILFSDVKPSNILVSTRGQVKLCDFGVSRQVCCYWADKLPSALLYIPLITVLQRICRAKKKLISNLPIEVTLTFCFPE